MSLLGVAVNSCIIQFVDLISFITLAHVTNFFFFFYILINNENYYLQL